ncbi:response regulator transcription factor [Microbacterium sp. zg.B48]|uniref:response regulator transcription factor n=1 Tax=unclassified Microbacterium TaxID=2609290 RepID=UPI00214B11FF|nr:MULTISPECIES: response regulator transcription factor [unclassified Microbacterium]MCR2762283.1 response regulator transcription factor [Microbacterium sp. zg.B48]MCR2809711.1 response regulator transcription factor [Microbacterium sp. zg.B185]WIM17972.1 response regulator transcription factor [Microbacterium sp. zg-B185]
MTKILIVEDEPRIADFVSRGLEAAGYITVIVEDGAEALERGLGDDIDLVLLDVGLPTMDGFEVLRQMRAQGSNVPVIMLTARSSTRDTVEGLDAGANDYVSKPFPFEELLARVRSRLRESTTSVGVAVSHGDVALDILSRRATVGDREVELSAREFALAEQFLRSPGRVLSREQLLSSVWGLDFDPGSNVVDVYVRYLRGKLGAAHIVTVRGAGYRWE